MPLLFAAIQNLANSCSADMEFGRVATLDMMDSWNGQGVNHRDSSKYRENCACELHDLEMGLTGGGAEPGNML